MTNSEKLDIRPPIPMVENKHIIPTYDPPDRNLNYPILENIKREVK